MARDMVKIFFQIFSRGTRLPRFWRFMVKVSLCQQPSSCSFCPACMKISVLAYDFKALKYSILIQKLQKESPPSPPPLVFVFKQPSGYGCISMDFAM